MNKVVAEITDINESLFIATYIKYKEGKVEQVTGIILEKERDKDRQLVDNNSHEEETLFVNKGENFILYEEDMIEHLDIIDKVFKRRIEYCKVILESVKDKVMLNDINISSEKRNIELIYKQKIVELVYEKNRILNSYVN